LHFQSLVLFLAEPLTAAVPSAVYGIAAEPAAAHQLRQRLPHLRQAVVPGGISGKLPK